LFQAAMRPTIEEPPWAKTLVTRVGQGDLRENLYDIGLELLGFFRQVVPLMMMTWSNPGKDGGLPDHLRGPNPPPLRALKRLSAFFEAEIRAGRLRRRDPEILARVFLGSLQNYTFFELVLGASDVLPLPEASYVRGMVDLLWSGAAPETFVSGHSSKSRSRR
jgi:hypothetical protein